MRLALLELRCRPSRFAGAATVLVLVAGLLVFLGGLADGLNANTDGALRIQSGDVVVFSAASQRSLPQSVVTAAEAQQVAAVPGVEAVGGIDLLQVGARLPGRGPRELVDVALFSFDIPLTDAVAPPPDGQVLADALLRERGVRLGTTMLLGPTRAPVVVAGFVTDSGYQGQGTLWGSRATFEAVRGEGRRADVLPRDAARVLVVRTAAGADAEAVARTIDATVGSTTTLTRAAAAAAVPDIGGAVFNALIGLTVLVGVIVVALFFILLTIERAALYGVLKAVGGRSRTLLAGVIAQATVLAALAGCLAVSAGVVTDAVLPPGGVPFELSPGRAVISVVLVLVAAMAGSTVSLRRIVRSDPASTIGRAT
jgi:putative ABC transport system permease protein